MWWWMEARSREPNSCVKATGGLLALERPMQVLICKNGYWGIILGGTCLEMGGTVEAVYGEVRINGLLVLVLVQDLSASQEVTYGRAWYL